MEPIHGARKNTCRLYQKRSLLLLIVVKLRFGIFAQFGFFHWSTSRGLTGEDARFHYARPGRLRDFPCSVKTPHRLFSSFCCGGNFSRQLIHQTLVLCNVMEGGFELFGPIERGHVWGTHQRPFSPVFTERAWVIRQNSKRNSCEIFDRKTESFSKPYGLKTSSTSKRISAGALSTTKMKCLKSQ